MIRERQLTSTAIAPGTVVTLDLPRDAVYHMIQLSISEGSYTYNQGTGGTGVTFEENFPFSLIKNIRLLRNGSDVVFQASGAQLAKEHYYLNKYHPLGRIFKIASNVETLLTSTVRGVTVPANAEGIGSCTAAFQDAAAPSTTQTVYFDMLLELWLQMGPENSWYGTLLDARKLASYQLEVSWANRTDICIDGTTNTVPVFAGSLQVQSIDQDNVSLDQQFGTFKRSSLSISNFQYGSSNQQVLLPRGNLFQGIIMQTQAAKARSATVMAPENQVITQVNNRINSNYTLRASTWKDLQRKNSGDGPRGGAFDNGGTGPQGWGYLYYPVAGQQSSELIPTFDMDQFDLQLSLDSLGNSRNGATTAASLPIINLLLEEIIPGVDVGSSGPRGAQAGSRSVTSAKPYSS